MKEAKATVQNDMGIHCRPSAVIANAVKAYCGRVVAVVDGGDEVDCSEVMGVMQLGLEKGDSVTIRVRGDDEVAFCDRVVKLFETCFDFPPR